MTNTKMTQEKALVYVLGLEEIQNNKEVADKLNDMLTSVRNKKTNKTVSKTQIANEEIKATMLELMTPTSLYTCTQMLKMLDDERVTSQQKVTSLFGALVDEGKVERVKDKKTTYFKKIQFTNGSAGKCRPHPLTAEKR